MRKYDELSGFDAPENESSDDQLEREYAELVALEAALEQVTQRCGELEALCDAREAERADAEVSGSATDLMGQATPRSFGRREFVVGAGAAGVLAAATGFEFARPDPAGATGSGFTLAQYMTDFGQAPGVNGGYGRMRWDYNTVLGGNFPDAALIVTRTDLTNGGPNATVALYADVTDYDAAGWPLYAECRGTTNDTATATSSKSAAIAARSYNRSAGTPVVNAILAEVRHGQDETDTGSVTDSGISIGVNIELNRFKTNPTVPTPGTAYGMFIENAPAFVPDSNGNDVLVAGINGTAALVINSTLPTSGTGVCGWDTGINFHGEPDSSAPDGKVAINLSGARYTNGIVLTGNTLQMNAGTRIYLDAPANNTYITYAPLPTNPTGPPVMQFVRRGNVVLQV
jgi:hypothetical protein